MTPATWVALPSRTASAWWRTQASAAGSASGRSTRPPSIRIPESRRRLATSPTRRPVPLSSRSASTATWPACSPSAPRVARRAGPTHPGTAVSRSSWASSWSTTCAGSARPGPSPTILRRASPLRKANVAPSVGSSPNCLASRSISAHSCTAATRARAPNGRPDWGKPGSWMRARNRSASARVSTAAGTGREHRGEHGDRADPVPQSLLADPAGGGRRPGLGRLAQPGLADGREVQPSSAGLPEQPQVPDVAVPLLLDVGVGKPDPVDAEAGEPHVVGVADTVQRGKVEGGHRTDAAAAELVDPGPHSTGHHADLIVGPAADRIDQLETDQVRQAAQAEHPAVGRLAGGHRPAREQPAAGAAGSPPGLVVDLA